MAGPWKIDDQALRNIALRSHSVFLSPSGISNKEAASRLGVSESTLSEYKRDHVERMLQVLAAHDFRIVNRDEMTISAQEKRALLKARIRADERELMELGDTQAGDL